jgi:hypothetical protein
VFASAAELLARSGVDAVVAHLWPVRAEVARAAAQDFYAHLIGARTGGGDVGASMQASRRTLLASSADGFSPVLYLRGPGRALFDLEERRLKPPKASPGRGRATGELPAALRTLLQGPFSLILGEAWDDEATVELRARLREGLLEALKSDGEGRGQTPLFSLAQRYSLQGGRHQARSAVPEGPARGPQPPRRARRSSTHSRRTCGPAYTRRCCGCRCSSTRSPVHHPDKPLYVIQPGPPGHEDRRLVMVRKHGEDEWEEVESLPRLKLDEAFVVLRLYGGYSPEAQPMLMSPQLTEDDHIQGLFELRYIVPPEWENMIMGWLRTRPVLCVGVSALDWRHRMLLRWLFDQRPPPVGSLAVLAESQAEDEIWEKRGAGLPGTGHFAVVHDATEALIEALKGGLA